MEQKYLHQVLPFLDELDAEKKKQLEEYFHTAPVWLLESFKIEYMEKGHIFVRENAQIEKVYIIAKGQVKATDYRVLGVAYDFMRFEGTYAMGGMEVIMDLKTYKTTLETVTPCIMISIPIAMYKKWLDTDVVALKQEAKAVTTYLTIEARQGRIYLFLEGAQRLEMLLIQRYEEGNVKGIYETASTRQELAEQTGLCVKTINRAVKKLEDEGLIGRNGNRITMNKNQYMAIKESVAKIIAV